LPALRCARYNTSKEGADAYEGNMQVNEEDFYKLNLVRLIIIKSYYFSWLFKVHILKK